MSDELKATFVYWFKWTLFVVIVALVIDNLQRILFPER